MAKVAIIVGRGTTTPGDDPGEKRGDERKLGKGAKYTDARVHVLRKVLTAPRTSD